MNMKGLSFFNREKPVLTCMVQAHTPERIKELAALSMPEGAEAFGMQFCQLEQEYQNEKTYRELIGYVHPLPVYATYYRTGKNKGKSDDELAEGLISIAESGAELCDVMGDYFDRCRGELTMDEKAIDRQKKLIDTIHSCGAKVLMSSHVLKFTPAERVLEIAYEHQRRGADICKIVTGAETKEQEIENIRIINLLKEKLDIPFLFLSGGECRLLRRVGSSVGSCMSLCVHEYDELATKSQPLLRDMKLLRELLEEK
ncbi:MAG: type I 3-dehydroquinate dehydratase [Ruminococcaceae bacterium]|nr:type I 3-dehydroquinate dehydratase [Oscillospiraceae bacterium]